MWDGNVCRKGWGTRGGRTPNLTADEHGLPRIGSKSLEPTALLSRITRQLAVCTGGQDDENGDLGGFISDYAVHRTNESRRAGFVRAKHGQSGGERFCFRRES